MAQDLLDDRSSLYDCKEPHLTSAMRTSERIHFVDFFDQSHPGETGGVEVLRIHQIIGCHKFTNHYPKGLELSLLLG